ncbi:unnamed protein product [Urochloa decumbens]|uniref:Uncharacterized protein n=1 Tax=Urochloa decumbens TaxID=240449 RepID=A0ABC9FZF8_9POAL
MAQVIGGEHHVHPLAHGNGDTLEKQLNGFVRAVALIERLGNALGTLAFTWATVVLLGGYPTALRQDKDFWFATAIVFLEALRMFSRNNRLDYQLFFDTRGAFRPLGWNGLTVALEIILDADGAVLEILIGLSSQICKVIPEDFARELEDGRIKDRFVKRLVDALNSYMEPRAYCPGIRRVILEQAINMMEYDSSYASYFVNRRMAEALSMVEETASEAENYSLFLGDVGLMEAREPLSSLVARAKQLLAVRQS